MAVQQLRVQLLAEIDFRFRVVKDVPLVLHDLEAKMVECAAHFVKPILCLHDDFVEPLLDSPGFLLLSERAKEPLAAPVPTRPTDPRIENATPVELNIPTQPMHEVDQFRLFFREADFMGD